MIKLAKSIIKCHKHFPFEIKEFTYFRQADYLVKKDKDDEERIISRQIRFLWSLQVKCFQGEVEKLDFVRYVLYYIENVA